MKLTPLKIAKAKQTRFGRFLCRLFGDERGAVMMEYVVLGVLVVAAAVALVMVFSKSLRHKLGVMIGVMDGKPSEIADNIQGERDDLMDDKDDAADQGDKIGNTNDAE